MPIRLPTISPQPRTAKAFELLAMAQDQGLDHPYSMRVLRAFFQEERDIGDPEVLVALAADAGLDPDEARGGGFPLHSHDDYECPHHPLQFRSAFAVIMPPLARPIQSRSPLRYPVT